MGLNDEVHLLHEAAPSRLGEGGVPSWYRDQLRQSSEMDKQEYVPRKEQDKTSGKSISVRRRQFTDKEFKVMVTKTLTKQEKNQWTQNLNRGGKYKNVPKRNRRVNNRTAELKHRPDEAEERISHSRSVELSQ